MRGCKPNSQFLGNRKDFFAAMGLSYKKHRDVVLALASDMDQRMVEPIIGRLFKMPLAVGKSGRRSPKMPIRLVVAALAVVLELNDESYHKYTYRRKRDN